MIRLIQSEWGRMWKRKIVWFLYLMIPVAVLAALKFSNQNNLNVSKQSPEFTVANNFQVTALHEMVIIFFNLFLLFLVVQTLCEEHRSGQLRMILLRSYTKGQVLCAKFLNVLLMLFAALLLFFVLSGGVGYCLLEHQSEVYLFYMDQPVSPEHAFFYTCVFYFYNFCCLATLCSVFMLIALYSPRVSVAMGMGIGFILLSLFYDTALNMLSSQPFSGRWVKFISYFSLTKVEIEGVHLMTANFASGSFLFVIVFIVYFGLFGGITYRRFVIGDYEN